VIVLARQRPLLEYYANSIAHLLPDGVATTPFHKEHERDTALPHLLPWTPPDRHRGGHP